MKKLMIMAAVAVAAVAANAASFAWYSGGAMYNGWINPSTSSTTYSGKAVYGNVTMYILNAATLSQAAFADDFQAGEITASSSDFTKAVLSSATLASTGKAGSSGSKIAFEADVKVDNYLNAYAVVFATDSEGEYAYVGGLKSVLASDTGKTGSFNPVVTSSQKGIINADDLVDSVGGWIQANPIPEPTSALMLVFGAGLLALRRRRA